jgi:hypothetical protein
VTAPTKLNSTNTRPVTTVEVLNAENQQAEREQLNRILKYLETQITSIGNRVTTLEESTTS